MSPLTWYCTGTMITIAPIFYFARHLRAYLFLSLLTVVGSATAAARRVDWAHPSEWIVMTVGLSLCVFGLFVVRVMLKRSVSLQMLATVDGNRPEAFSEGIEHRLHEMQVFHFVQTCSDGRSELTGLGRLVSQAVALMYSFFRVET